MSTQSLYSINAYVDYKNIHRYISNPELWMSLYLVTYITEKLKNG